MAQKAKSATKSSTKKATTAKPKAVKPKAGKATKDQAKTPKAERLTLVSITKMHTAANLPALQTALQTNGQVDLNLNLTGLLNTPAEEKADGHHYEATLSIRREENEPPTPQEGWTTIKLTDLKNRLSLRTWTGILIGGVIGMLISWFALQPFMAVPAPADEVQTSVLPSVRGFSWSDCSNQLQGDQALVVALPERGKPFSRCELVKNDDGYFIWWWDKGVLPGSDDPYTSWNKMVTYVIMPYKFTAGDTILTVKCDDYCQFELLDSLGEPIKVSESLKFNGLDPSAREFKLTYSGRGYVVLTHTDLGGGSYFEFEIRTKSEESIYFPEE